MKKMGRILSILLLAVVVAAGIPTLPAKAEGYTYTVRFYAGQQGTFKAGQQCVIKSNGQMLSGSLKEGNTVVEFTGLEIGDRVTFSRDMVTLSNNSKYYIKGIRESGKDNETIERNSFPVEGDRDYVVGYGLLGDSVAYTVNYVDRNGNALIASETYYGNVGDKPVVAYRYIEGYEPQAYNLTKTLSSRPGDNQFTFIYRRVSGGTTTTTTTETVVDRGVVGITGEPGTTTTITTEESQSNGNGDRDNGGGNDGQDTENGDDMTDQEDAGAPQEIVNLDDEEVPLAQIPNLFGSEDGGLKVGSDARIFTVVSIVVCVMTVLAVIAASLWFWMKRREKESDE